MIFVSKLNTFFQLLRLFFLSACIVLLLVVFNIYQPGDTNFSITLYAKIITSAGLLYGTVVTLLGLHNGLRTIVIKNDTIYIYHIYCLNKRSYSLFEIGEVKEKEYDDSRFFVKGIRIEFKNGDYYNFVSYNYLNYRKLRKAVLALKKEVKT